MSSPVGTVGSMMMCSDSDNYSLYPKPQLSLFIMYTVYAVIFKGRKFRRFRCKLVKREILILEKKQWLKETMYSTWWTAKIKLQKSLQTYVPRNIRPSKITAYTVY